MEPGQCIDIWKVDHALGSGGMGSVYRCHNVGAERILAAIKVLDTHLAASEDAKARFVREAEILFRLQHPNIVRVRNVRMDASPPYLEMDFVVGTSLEELLQGGEPLPIRQAMDLMEELAGALSYLHARNVRHRDIKPANLLIDESGHIVLVDFGLAMETDGARITRTGMAFGTIAYVPPEWLDPDALDPVQWDLYAAGVVFYEMLTGKTAFPMSGEGDQRKQLMQVVLKKQRTPPLDIGEDHPSALRDLIRDLTQVDPAHRPQSADEVCERLARARTALEAVDWKLGEAPGAATVPRAHRREFDGSQTPTAPPGRAAPTPRAPAPHAPAPPQLGPTSEGGRAVWLLLPASVAGAALVAWLIATPSPQAPSLTIGPLELGPRSPVEVVVPELEGEVPVAVSIGDHAPTEIDGRVHHFLVPDGYTAVLWAAGEGCEPVACHNEECPAWCGHGSEPLEVRPGDEPVRLELDFEAARPNLTFEFPRLEEGRKGLFRKQQWPIRLYLDDRPGGMIDHWRVGLLDVPAGSYTLQVEIGSCEDEDEGCWPDGVCPAGCRSMVEEDVVVPWQHESILRELRIKPPREPE